MKNKFEHIDSMLFDEYGEIKQYSKLVFMNEECEKEFFQKDPGVQRAVLSLIRQTAKEMQSKLQREMNESSRTMDTDKSR
jgi:hypothetical protein